MSSNSAELHDIQDQDADRIHDALARAGNLSEQHQWHNVRRTKLRSDGSQRSYWRLTHAGGGTTILMTSLPDGHPRQTPGHRLDSFISLGERLKHNGFSVPEIYAADTQSGWIVMEDFGNRKLARFPRMRPRILSLIRRFRQLPSDDLPGFSDSHIARNHRLFLDWYLPQHCHTPVQESQKEEFKRVCTSIQAGMPAPRNGFIYVDLHGDNIMLLPGRAGLRSLGLLDYQGALHGPLAYDLAHYLYDPRFPVSRSQRGFDQEYALKSMTKGQKESFRRWTTLLGAQLSLRCLGQYVRLDRRDGKSGYRSYIPTAEANLAFLLQDPLLKPLQEWLGDHFHADLPLQIRG